MKVRIFKLFVAASVVTTLVGCSSNMASMTGSTTTTTTTTPTPSVISQLKAPAMVGTTVDVGTGAGAGDTNPYGLAIVPSTVTNTTAISGTSTVISPGDLIVCNFNSATASGMGTTIEDIRPVAGTVVKPVRVVADASLTGCDALALNPTAGAIWAAAYTANDNPIVKTSGAVALTLAGNSTTYPYAWNKPWGQIYGQATAAAGATTTPPAAFYATDAGDGSVIQINLTSTGFVYNKIVTGFPTSVSATYGILAPAGLTYDPSSDTLYVVSSDTNSVLAFSKVSTIANNGIVINFTPGTSTGGAYPTTTNASFAFSGPNASQAKVIFSGSPLNYPVSSALLYNGDLIVGNTGDNNMVEISPSTGAVVGTPSSVDSGPAGAIFGIATSGTTLATQKIYFNDDNNATVYVLSQ